MRSAVSFARCGDLSSSGKPARISESIRLRLRTDASSGLSASHLRSPLPIAVPTIVSSSTPAIASSFFALVPRGQRSTMLCTGVAARHASRCSAVRAVLREQRALLKLELGDLRIPVGQGRALELELDQLAALVPAALEQ